MLLGIICGKKGLFNFAQFYNVYQILFDITAFLLCISRLEFTREKAKEEARGAGNFFLYI